MALHCGLTRAPARLPQLLPVFVNRCLIGCASLACGKPPPHPYCGITLDDLKVATTTVYLPARRGAASTSAFGPRSRHRVG